MPGLSDMSSLSGFGGATSATTPTRPPMPTDVDQARSEHQFTRWQILNEDWEDVERLWLEQYIDPERLELWGPPDLSANPLSEIARALTTPGLYGRRPSPSNADGSNAEILIAPNEQLDQAGYFSKMQRTQYLAWGMVETFLALDVVQGRVTFRPVRPSDVYVEVDPDRPDVAVKLWELRLRPDAIKKGAWIYTWDKYDLGEKQGEVVIREPSYTITDADGEDVSGSYLRRPDGTFGAMTGAAYPYRYEDSEPFLRHQIYRTVDSGEYWNYLDRRGLHRGTLNTALYYTYAGHCAKDASGSMVIVVGASEPAGDVRIGSSGEPTRSLVQSPGGMLFLERDGDSQPMITEVGPAGNLTEVAGWAREYKIEQATRAGLNPADITRQHANPTSGAALAISNKQRRETMAQVEPLFRAADLECFRKCAALLRIAGVDQFVPETGYAITYAPIPESPQETEDKRTQIDWEVGNDYLSPIDAYIRLHPGTSRDAAAKALTENKLDRARLSAAFTDALQAAGLGDSGDDSESALQSFNELSLAAERVARLGDLDGLNAIRRRMADALGTKYPGDLTELAGGGGGAPPAPPAIEDDEDTDTHPPPPTD